MLIVDSVSYFYSQLDRLWTPDYSPTNQDIIQTRARSAGIAETVFKISESFSKSAIPDPLARAVTPSEKCVKHTSASPTVTPRTAPSPSEESTSVGAAVEKEQSRFRSLLKGVGPRDLRFVDVGEFRCCLRTNDLLTS